MATARKRISPQEKEEYERLLVKGGELLAQGKVIEAKDYLEKAYALDPRNEKGQNLLGLSYFKLGLFERASEIYEVLVRENPADHTLRVNLGLVYLKTNALQRAIREFETATDLAPEHKKAHNYLGLALAQAGEYGRAREHFIAAGSEAMAEKMARAMSGETFAQPPPPKAPDQGRGFAEIEGSEVVAERGGEVPAPTEAPPAEAAPAEPAPATAEKPAEDFEIHEHEDEGEDEKEAKAEEASWDESFTETEKEAEPAAAQPEIELSEADQEPARPAEPTAPVGAEEPKAPWASPEPAARPPLPTTSAPRPSSEERRPLWRPRIPPGPPPLLAELAVNARVPAHPDAAFGAFHSTEDTLVVAVEGEVLTRVVGLVAFHGTVQLSPELKRVRARKTDRPFGVGERQMMRASGKGALVIATGYQAFLSVDLGDESAYFREEVLFAFEEALSFENGKVPIRDGAELELVHLRGKGRALIALSGPLRSIEVRMDQPVTVPLTHLIGWQGNLTPRIVTMPIAPPTRPPADAVELSGEGFALFEAPA